MLQLPRQQRLDILRPLAVSIAAGCRVPAMWHDVGELLRKLLCFGDLAGDEDTIERRTALALAVLAAVARTNDCRDATTLILRAERYANDSRFRTWVKLSLLDVEQRAAPAAADSRLPRESNGAHARDRDGVSIVLEVAARVGRCVAVAKQPAEVAGQACALMQDAWEVLHLVRGVARDSTSPARNAAASAGSPSRFWHHPPQLMN